MNTELDQPKTLEPSGKPPASRMDSALATRNFVEKLILNDQSGGRNYKRSRTQGLDDGNPPYSNQKLKDAGRPADTNVNWGTARGHREKAQGVFFDLFAESPTYLEVQTAFGENPDDREEWSRIMTEEADAVLRDDSRWNYAMQNSQKNMVLHGCGPLFFEPGKALPRSCRCGDVMVPEQATSEPAYWEFAAVLSDYLCHELYEFIKDATAAGKAGWKVRVVKDAILNAVPKISATGAATDWEFWQQQLKHNAYATSADSQVVRVAHCFWKEFDGKITHAIVPLNHSSKTAQGTEVVEYLFLANSRYDAWGQIIHPMYYDLGNGTHYSVTGMGVKMYGALLCENRLLCNLADKAFSPKLLFKPTTADVGQTIQMVPKGDYGVLNVPADVVQTGVAGLMDDGLAMHNVLNQVVSNNLAMYTQTWQRHQGNPPTARQVTLEAQEQSRISATQISRYYEQLDKLYAEIYRRLAEASSTCALAKEFQKRCKERNVPMDAVRKVKSVRACRVSGQGSRSMRQSALGNTLPILPRLPENGQENVVRDFLASMHGQSKVERYFPSRNRRQLPDGQQSEAMLWVSAMKQGIQPVISQDQNPAIFAVVWLGAAANAVESLEQGANQMEVLQFLRVCVPGIIAQVNRFRDDPSRKQMVAEFDEQVKKLASIADQLEQQIQKAVEDKAKADAETMQAQQEQGGGLPPEAIAKIRSAEIIAAKKAETMGASHGQRMQQRQEIHEEKLREEQDKHNLRMATETRLAQVETAIADLKGAAEVRREAAKAKAKSKAKPKTAE